MSRNLSNSVWGREAERCHVARLEVDSGAPDTVGLKERERTREAGPLAGKAVATCWSGQRGMRLQSREGDRGEEREGGSPGEKKGLTSKTIRGWSVCVCCFLRDSTGQLHCPSYGGADTMVKLHVRICEYVHS